MIAYATTTDPGYLYASSDAGNTWLPLNPTYPGEPAPPSDPFNTVAAALSADGATLYTINANGTLFKSMDGGKTWTRLASGLTNPVRMQFDPNNGSTLYVVTQYLGFSKSVDGGLAFARLITPFPVQQFAFDDSGVLYVASFTAVDVSPDGGATFNPVPQLVNSYSINALSSVAGKVYVSSLAPSVPFVVKLNPAGTTILAATFLGGSAGDYPTGLAVDSQGQPVLVGFAVSADFPFTSFISASTAVRRDAGFIAKLSSDGSHLIFATGLGASKGANIQAVAVDSSGDVYVTGATSSPDFPTTMGAFQTALPSSTCPRQATNPFVNPNSGQYAFVSKLAPDGSSLAFSTFLTGSCGSFGRGLTVAAGGEAFVAGATTSPDFPVQTASYQAAFPGALNVPSPPGILQAGFAAKLSAKGDKLLASTFLGGGYSSSGTGVTLDTAGNPYLTGSTQGFATKTTPGVVQPTFVDQCNPTFNIGPGPPYGGTSDTFVLKLDPALSTAGFLTYFGGSCNDSGANLALDAGGNIWLAGFTSSPDLPLKDPFQVGGIYSTTAPGFVAELSPDASQLFFSSYTEGSALALNSSGVFLAGTSGTMVSAAKIDPLITPAIHIDNVAPVVNFPSRFVPPVILGVVPGLLVQITGRNLGPATKVNAQFDGFNRLPSTVANTSVLFDGIPAPLLSVQASSIICFVPFEVGSTTQITVLANGQKSNSVRAGVSAVSPQILSVANQDGRLNSASNPAKFGSAIVLYVSGLGQTTPLSVDGLVNTVPLSVPNVPVSPYITGNQGSSPAQAVVSAPGMIAGITQVNVALPASLPPELSADTRSLTVSILAAQAPVYVSQ